MDKKEARFYITRVDRFAGRIARKVLAQAEPFEVHFASVDGRMAWSERPTRSLRPFAVGEVWGRNWESGWFHLKGTIPDGWKGRSLVAHLDVGGEGLLFDARGNILQGITNGSVFDSEFSRDIVHLDENTVDGDTVELWIEAAANGLFGVFTEPDPGEDSPNRYGHYDARLNAAELCLFDAESWYLWLDLQVLMGLVQTAPEKSVRRARVIRVCNEAIDTYGRTSSVSACREILRTELDHPASSSDMTVTAVGHAHIDTAWLWPVSETIRKCARTFASQLALIDRYPGYVFGASQAQHYAFVKEHYPELYERIEKAVDAGRWEIQGGMWVEADCNLIGGESMIRQILHGKNFFRDEFGVDVGNLWLPDVFGYSAALPQMLKKSGIEFFLTQKMSWNQFNDFPHHTFRWRGIDGSEVLTHFPPEDTYNSQLSSRSLILGRDNFKEKDRLDEFMCLFGVGDGGGGPKEEYIEYGRRLKDLEGAPRVRFDKASSFFERLSKCHDQLETWSGELYLELHRGTLTTQAKVKRANRKLENKLREVELLYACLPLDKYPSDSLDTLWKTVLRNQFHDIIPGSSITSVYEDTLAELAEVDCQCDQLIDKVATGLFEKDSNRLVVFNPSPYAFSGPVLLPEDWIGGVADEAGQELPVQSEAGRIVAYVRMEPLSFITLIRSDGVPEASSSSGDLILENELVRYEFNNRGALTSAYDKQADREIIASGAPGNVLSLYHDHPNDWDAWDIDITYENCLIENAQAVESRKLPSGKIRQGLVFEATIGNSTVHQEVRLAADSRRLDFHTRVDWREKHRMLRVSFPVNIHSEQASFDIQYGYINRPTHRNTLWDKARFEVVGHRYADLSEPDYGVALLNDCKYGYRVIDNVLDLNLLRSPTYPDPDADQGEHVFTYSLLPHTGDLVRSDVMANADQLNREVRVFEGVTSPAVALPCRLDGEGLALEVIKKAEKEDCLVVRIIEALGRRSHGTLHVDDAYSELIATDLMEWHDGVSATCGQPFDLTLEPFDIRTFKIVKPRGRV